MTEHCASRQCELSHINIRNVRGQRSPEDAVQAFWRCLNRFGKSASKIGLSACMYKVINLDGASGTLMRTQTDFQRCKDFSFTAF